MPASRPNWVAGGKGWKVCPPVRSSASAIAASTCAVAASAPVKRPAAPVALAALAAATNGGRRPA
eukprot:1317678-Prorocentrum_lima.AAC.1